MPSDRWNAAFESLTADDRATLNTSSSNMLEVLREIVISTEKARDIAVNTQWRVKWKGEVIEIRQVAGKIIRWVNEFKQFGDLIMQYDPGHAALPWAAVRIVLHSITAEHESMALVWVGIERCAYLIDRCAVYEGLLLLPSLRASAGLVAALIKLYTAILRLLSRSKLHCSKGIASK